MIYRAIALSLAIVVGMAAIIPLTTNGVEAGSRKSAKKKQKKYKKYSKQWWRAYHQRNNNRNSLNARKRSLRLRQIRLANARQMSETNNLNQAKAQFGKTDNSPVMLPSGEPAPNGWRRGASSTGEVQYSVVGDSGSNLGSAAISVVGTAVGTDTNKTVGGVAVTALRRTVIDRMIKEGGWVVNDYQKEVGNRKVYVVVAKSADAGGAAQSRLFYFTEADGRIYSVATNAPNDGSRWLEEQSEKAVISLQRRTSPTQQAELK